LKRLKKPDPHKISMKLRFVLEGEKLCFRDFYLIGKILIELQDELTERKK